MKYVYIYMPIICKGLGGSVRKKELGNSCGRRKLTFSDTSQIGC